VAHAQVVTLPLFDATHGATSRRCKTEADQKDLFR
jgi:hypothetical protein